MYDFFFQLCDWKTRVTQNKGLTSALYTYIRKYVSLSLISVCQYIHKKRSFSILTCSLTGFRENPYGCMLKGSQFHHRAFNFSQSSLCLQLQLHPVLSLPRMLRPLMFPYVILWCFYMSSCDACGVWRSRLRCQQVVCSLSNKMSPNYFESAV